MSGLEGRERKSKVYNVQAIDSTDQAQRYARNLEFKLNCFFEKIYKSPQSQKITVEVMEEILRKISNSRVYYVIEQAQSDEFICLRKFKNNPIWIDQFKIIIKEKR